MKKISKFVIGRDIQNKKYKIPVADLVFRPSVYGLIFKNGKILLSKAWDGYDFPGGGVEKGESIKNALKREVWEETGIGIKPRKFIAIYEDFFISIESKRKLHSLLMYYVCTSPKGKISTKNLAEDEKTYVGKAEWIDLKNIKKIKFYNGVDSIKLIQKALNLK